MYPYPQTCAWARDVQSGTDYACGGSPEHPGISAFRFANRNRLQRPATWSLVHRGMRACVSGGQEDPGREISFGLLWPRSGGQRKGEARDFGVVWMGSWWLADAIIGRQAWRCSETHRVGGGDDEKVSNNRRC